MSEATTGSGPPPKGHAGRDYALATVALTWDLYDGGARRAAVRTDTPAEEHAAVL